VRYLLDEIGETFLRSFKTITKAKLKRPSE